jgi:hypothetical protein
MRVLGWAELVLGLAWGALWLLTLRRAVPLRFGADGSPDRIPWLVQALSGVGFGVLTLRAVWAVRRAGASESSAVAGLGLAVERLKELFAAQLCILLLAVAVAVLSALL